MGRTKKSLQTHTERRKNNNHTTWSQRQNQRFYGKHPEGAKHALTLFFQLFFGSFLLGEDYSPPYIKSQLAVPFYVSGQFQTALSDLILHLCSSKTRKIQLTLQNEELKSNSWRVLGFVGASLLNLDAEIWTVLLTKEQINDCFAEWKKYKQYD